MLAAPLTSMLKTTLALGIAASVNVEDKKRDGKEFQVENQDEKKSAQPAQKSCKSQPKGQKTAK